MDDLLHGPRTKQQIKDLLYGFLYAPVQKQFKKQLDALIVRNSVLMQTSHASFIYKGTVYSCDESPMPRRMNHLSPQLQPLMEDYLKEVKQLNNNELPYVLGFINQVLNASNDLQDYLRVLPSAIHRPIEALIASCPCRSRHLTEDGIATLKQNNQMPIQLIKKRMVTNLIL